MFDTRIKSILNSLYRKRNGKTSVMRSFNKILFLCPSSAVGDTVVETYFTRTIKERYPQAQITVAIRPPYQELIDHRIVDKVILLPSNSFLKFLFLLLKIPFFRKQEYDLIIDLPYSSYAPWRYLFLYCLKGKAVLASNVTGYDFITYSFSWKESSKHITEEVYDKALALLGISAQTKGYQVPIQSKSIENITTLLEKMGINSHDKILLLNPEGSLWMRKMSPQKAVTLAEELSQKLPKWKIIILQFNQHYPAVPANIHLLALTHLNALVALINRCNYIISVDTGTVHLADAFKKPMCVLFSAIAKEGFLRPYVEKFWGSINTNTIYLTTSKEVNEISNEAILFHIFTHFANIEHL